MAETTKRYIISTLVTFFAGFLVVVTPEVTQLTVDTAQTGAVLGIVMAGVRAGVKAVAEMVITK